MLRFLIFSVVVFFYVVQGHYSGLNVTNDGPAGGAPMALLKFIFSMFFFINGVRYVVVWEEVSPKSFLLSIVKYAAVPYITLFCVFKYNISLAFSHNIVGLLAVFSFAFYLLSHKKITEFISERMPINDYDKRHLFKSYPPRNRSDIFRFDIFMLFTWSIPLLFNIE
jgi:hypothetical protein